MPDPHDLIGSAANAQMRTLEGFNAGAQGVSADHHGVYAETGSAQANGVHAKNTSTQKATRGSNYGNGVFGHTAVPNANGVCGHVEASNTEGAGVCGVGPTAGRFFGDVDVRGGLQVDHISHHTGRVKLSGVITVNGGMAVKDDLTFDRGIADFAEDFDVVDTTVEDGTIMCLSDTGALAMSTKAYDKAVVGVISGAGTYKPGIVLDRNGTDAADRRPVALVGKVFCKVDASTNPIQVGDLLTTSSIPGHAMKADDPLKAFGAVIGKALKPLHGGMGLIPILVSLQ